MDIKPMLLPLQEVQTRKARDLRKRGYSDADIAETMGISTAHLADLLPPARPAAETAGKDKKKSPAAAHSP